MVDIKRLRRFKFLDVLDDAELEPWLDKFGEESRPRNEVIFREGETAERFYLVESGQLSANCNVPGGQQFLGYYVAGDVFGATSLVESTPRRETVDAVSQVSLLFLARADFLEFYNEYPEIQREIDAGIVQRSKRRLAEFPSKRAEEALVHSTHRHALWLITRIAAWSAFFIPATIALVAFGGQVLLGVAAGAAAVYVLGLLWYTIDWQNDWFIVSSRRVLHHERTLFLFEEIEEAGLDKIQNVTSEMPNLFANLFDFGDVTIQTAAGGGRIVFDFVPRARHIRETIEAERTRMGEHARQMEISRLRQTIRRELQQEIGLGGDKPDADSLPGGVSVQGRSGILRRMFGNVHIIAPSYAHKGDQIIWRKHVLLLLRDISMPILMLTVVIAFTLYMLYSDIVGIGLLSVPATLLIAVVLTPLALFWLWYEYRDWENDIYVLTPDRLIDSERQPLWLQERVRVASLGQVQNVTFKRDTFIQNMFDYGTVLIQTAGGDSGLTFDHIPNPRRAQAFISDALERFRERERMKERQLRRREFLDWFGEYHRLLSQPHTPPDNGAGARPAPVV
ncbi:MAG: cyclic nucleotide-binding domain-containing protein [Chloroflexi bacterium]|nr:cyclic nucleotide-binding domain-containing protein [Chloroflexota bacterium]